MHVDEVQIDGGGTEAVITGNMENPGKRLIVLEGDEVEALYGRPCFFYNATLLSKLLAHKESRGDMQGAALVKQVSPCLLYTSPSPRD